MNAYMQASVGLDRPALCYADAGRRLPWITSWGTKLLVGDPVIVMDNNYDEDADLRNGDLGTLIEVCDTDATDSILAYAEFSGSVLPIKKGLAEKLELAYSVTIHKAQGSQWPNLIVALPASAKRMLDQSLLYTAVTRAEKRLIVHGSDESLAYAVQRGSIALSRKVGLTERLQQLLIRTAKSVAPGVASHDK